MKLTYKQTISNNYSFLQLENSDQYIVAHTMDGEPQTKDIEIYSSPDPDISFSKNEAEKIYSLLQEATTHQSILEFCQKYGTLINLNSPIVEGRYFRTKKIIACNAQGIDISTLTENELNCFTEPVPLNTPATDGIASTVLDRKLNSDHMHLSHFNYYVQVLRLMDELYDKSIESLSSKDVHELAELLFSFLVNIYDMLNFEYTISDAFIDYISAFPFYHYAFSLLYFPYEQYRAHMIVSNMKVAHFIQDLEDVLQHGSSVQSQDYSKDLEQKLITKVKSIAPYIYADILNFHLKDIPFSLFTSSQYDPLCNSFYTLGDAIIFQKIIDLTSSKRMRRCKNNYCRAFFQPEYQNQEYCSPACRSKYNTRKSMTSYRAKLKAEKELQSEQ